MSSALERREARIGPVYVLAVVLLFLPSIGTCGGIGAFKARLAASNVAAVAIEDVANGSRTPAGSYVETTANLRVVSRDTLPYDEESVIAARGATLFSVVGTPSLIVYCEDSACAGLDAREAPVRLRGQVCNGDESLLCVVPRSVQLHLQREAHLRRPHRVLLAGQEPSANVWEAAVGIGIALGLLFVLAGVLFATTRRRESAHLLVERSVTMRGGKDAALAALQKRRGTTFRLADDGGDQLTFLAGAEASRARLMGVRSPEDVARRVAIRFEEQAAYRPGLVTITVTEILPFPRGITKQLRPIVLTALNQTLSEVEQLVTAADA